MLDLTLDGLNVPKFLCFLPDKSRASLGYFFSICVLKVIPLAVAETGLSLVGTISYSSLTKRFASRLLSLLPFSISRLACLILATAFCSSANSYIWFSKRLFICSRLVFSRASSFSSSSISPSFCWSASLTIELILCSVWVFAIML